VAWIIRSILVGGHVKPDRFEIHTDLFAAQSGDVAPQAGVPQIHGTLPVVSGGIEQRESDCRVNRLAPAAVAPMTDAEVETMNSLRFSLNCLDIESESFSRRRRGRD